MSENQLNILSAVGCEQKNRQNRELYVVLFGVSNSTAATEEEREKEDAKTTREILEEIGIELENDELDIKKIRRIKITSKILNQSINSISCGLSAALSPGQSAGPGNRLILIKTD